MNRPSHKELYGKIIEARHAVSEGFVSIIKPDAVACDAIELDYAIDLELLDVLSELLNEISPSHYAGKRPPEKSYEQEITGLDLFAFKIESKRFKCRVYLKFAIVESELWLVSLHQDRDKKEENENGC
ncbi:MAG: hypothetical protein K9L30_11515 [Desulfobacterales bacterium]|nr:hypothetical protein [Desulfobacterales bacterium]